jgi:D-glycero-alpha-D-manno-heptose-7-phosphate kinase
MSPPAAAEATAPTRVDLAGGTLDIWPLGLFHPGAMTVNVAIDRRAWARVEVGGTGVVIESKDTPSRVEARDLSELLARPDPPLAAHVLAALGVGSGVRVSTRSRVPPGSGLGGSSAIAVAVAGAAERALGLGLDREALLPLVRDAEVRALGVPTGLQDHAAALHGGVNAVRFERGGTRVERLAADPGRIEEHLLLVDAGQNRFSGLNNWDVFRGQVEGRAGVRDGLGTIARVASAMRGALLQADFERVGGLLREEWSARKTLGPGVSTPEVDRIAAIAEELGGAAKVCGAGGGGMVAVWAAPGARGEGPRERVLEGLGKAGFKVFPARVELLGLEVTAS